ncbi:MAG: glycoside hydrolase [Hungatella sp.]|jgi:alpha-D-xyloside xylohydrolase|nr:glycoside hydrolase [Hungatella sp.]
MKYLLAGQAIYGFGERFDALDQTGLVRENHVYETFTNQGACTYLPVPFAITDSGMGMYVDSMEKFSVSTEKTSGGIAVTLSEGYGLRIFSGKPLDILEEFVKLTGLPKMPPDWAFGLWMSANRWNSQELVEEQVEEAIRQGMKPSVVVLEAWSDEATFYRFDKGRFPDPRGMIEHLHKQGIRIVLWQIPVLKKLNQGNTCPEHEADCAEAVANGFVVKNADGSPYLIPEGRWFGGAMIPDFTNPAACDWWFGKRRYLLDIGVDGFKTDGGEFIYEDSVRFFNGKTGASMRNGYAVGYTKAYTDFAGSDRVLFSRAGYTGSQMTPIHWAGDQQSTWEELRHVLTAGLNAGVSGLPFWSFDIAGFAGELPSAELYLRSFALACFCPVIQWHSEPPGGQFADILAVQEELVNDRSPWNIAKIAKMPEVTQHCRRLCEEREKLLPYILKEAEISARTGRPMMAALMVDWSEDKQACAIDDEYMFGSELLAAPVLERGAVGREVYLPAGKWKDYWTGEETQGPCRVFKECPPGGIPVWRLTGAN